MTQFSKVKDSCARVSKASDYVGINLKALPAYAEQIINTSSDASFYDEEHHFLGREDETAAYILVLDCINFGSGYFPFLKKRKGMSGYFTVSTLLKDWFLQNGVPSAEQLSFLSLEGIARIFKQELDHPKNTELMSLFTQALNDLGKMLTDKYGSSYTNFINQANHSANKLAEQLLEMPLLQDQSMHKGKEVYFYKRAQITPSDLALALNNQGLGLFHDINDVTIFADNLVPHVLRVDGVLEYHQDLIERLEQNPFLEAGCQEEVELRAVSIHAVELMVQHLQTQGHEVYARDLDMILWNRGLAQKYRDVPRHRSQTVFY